jgi:hypothetical protein
MLGGFWRYNGKGEGAESRVMGRNLAKKGLKRSFFVVLLR